MLGSVCIWLRQRGDLPTRPSILNLPPYQLPLPAALPLQHFTSEDGAYYGGHGPFKCSPIPALPAVQRNATVRARVAAGGWYNVGIKPLVPLLGDAHLRTW